MSFNLINIIEENFLRHLHSLEHLLLNDNGLKHIEPYSFEDLFVLKHLSLRWNSLKKLNENSLYNLTSLISLDMAHNEFTQINILKSNLAFLSHLETFDLSFNLISSIEKDDFSFGLNLKSINLNHNLIKSIHQETFLLHTRLETFKIAKSRLDHFDLSLLKRVEQNIQELDVNFNQNVLNSEMLQFNDLKVIKAEQCTNILSSLFLSKLQFLISLDLSSNNLDKHFDTFNHLTLLTRLELRNVGLKSMRQINFRNFLFLKHLDLSHNLLTQLDFVDFEMFLVTFEYLDVSYNFLYSIDDEILMMGSFYSLEDNSISYLNFEHNNLSVMTSKYLYNYLNLKILKLSFNSLTAMPTFLVNDDYDHSPFNEEFYFDHNQIKTLTPFNIWSHPLKILNLDFNQIEYIERDALFNLISLQNFSMAMNRLKRIEANNLQKCYDLNYLNLSRNLIEIIEADSFLNLNKLLSLDVSFNCLKRLEANLFRGLQRLSSLYIWQSLELIEINNQSFRYLINISNVYLNELMVIENKCLFMHSLFERPIQRNLSNRYIFYKSLNLITETFKTTNICFLTFHLLQMKIHLNLKSDYENELFYDMCQDVLVGLSTTFGSNLQQCHLKNDNHRSRWFESKNEVEFSFFASSSFYLVFTNFIFDLTLLFLLSLFIPILFLICNHLIFD